MAKEVVTCRDCPCCENLPGGAIALCWRPYDGPQVVDAMRTGFCGSEWVGDDGEAPGHLAPRELWLAGHQHTREELAQVLMLLRLASAGAKGGDGGEAMSKVKRTERGWAAHFICVGRCAFRRNTLLQCGRKRIVVSTVGDMRLKDDGEIEEIGLERFYETMAFHAVYEKPYWEANIEREVSFESPWSLEGPITQESDLAANDMHERVVQEISRQMEVKSDD